LEKNPGSEMASTDIAIPNYNYGRYLNDCVQSVLNQNAGDVRILIIDNASTDDSLTIARRLERQHSQISLVTHTKNLGAQSSWNEAIDWAQSDYFMILCSDDMLASGTLARAVSFLEAHKDVSFVHGQEITILETGEREHPELAESDASWRIMAGEAFISASCTAPANYINAGTMVIRTAAQKKAGHFRPHLRYTDDLEMMLRLALHGSVAETSAVQGIRRLHGANMSESFAKDSADELRHRNAAFESFFAKEGKELCMKLDLRKKVRKGLAERSYWWGVRELSKAQMSSALALFKLGFHLHPLTMIVPPIGHLFTNRNELNGFTTVRTPISNLLRRA
jgi:glycosyltransferase involved in cell wall biosynthesis